MAGENKVQQVTTKEPQQVQQVTTKEPQQVTMKDPKKVEAGKRLAESNHRKNELKAQKQKIEVEPMLTYCIGAILAVGGDRWSWLLPLPSQERRSQCHASSVTFTPATR